MAIRRSQHRCYFCHQVGRDSVVHFVMWFCLAHRQAGKLDTISPAQDCRTDEIVSSVHRQAEALEATSLPASRRENGHQ